MLQYKMKQLIKVFGCKVILKLNGGSGNVKVEQKIKFGLSWIVLVEQLSEQAKCKPKKTMFNHRTIDRCKLLLHYVKKKKMPT